MLPRVLHINISHTFPINFENVIIRRDVIIFRVEEDGERSVRDEFVCTVGQTEGANSS